jgi:hypothetical protein
MDRDSKTNQPPRPHFWMWGDPTTVRNPIREAWEAKQQAKKNPREEARMEFRRKHGRWPEAGEEVTA